jgi:hypothetical protein
VVKHNVLETFKQRKESADRFWKWHFNEALQGRINRENLFQAMQMSNIADKALICYEQNRGVKCQNYGTTL